ncbi:Xaa-Pro aminopeptidase [Kushneria aurantia]|uniref:Xaa-Pro aminopeptidase n=1 Tax=Kushneria aurantia TaxID=504092 RepID=A0ABV6G1H3_9GAMM|nr:Xaa-Pro aminopeptidase [Kushneria aurantia]
MEELSAPASIGVETYRARRDRLMRSLPADSAVLIPAGQLQPRSGDADYPFRQHSDFHYLCGFPEPQAWLVLLPGRQAGAAVLLCRGRDPDAETWTGRRLGPRRAVSDYGLDEARELDECDAALDELLDGRRSLYLPLDDERSRTLALATRRRLVARERDGAVAPSRLVDVTELIHDQRLIKSDAEIAIMAHAGAISARAHRRAMAELRPGMFEYQLQAHIEHEFLLHGARSPAYDTIVGGGANACVLHYCDNAAVLRDGELVLIDAGAEYALYAGDITRTLPVGGRFREPQRQLYEIVLGAQQRALRAVRPGVRLRDIHDGVVADLSAGLVALGLLEGPVERVIAEGHYKRFFPHGTSHWLGLDVHDAGAYRVDGESRALAPGMVLTVEPGLYIPDDPDIPTPWQGIGIRIEDDVVVTAEGSRVLTADVPKSVAEIEALMAIGRERTP